MKPQPSRQKPTLFSGHEDKIWSVAFSPDGTALATGSEDQSMKLWDIASGTCRTFLCHNHSVNSVAFSPSGLSLASAGEDGFVKVWETKRGLHQWTGRSHLAGVNAVVFSADGKLLASGGGDDFRVGEVRIWDAIKGRELAQFAHPGEVLTLAFSPQGRYLASADFAGAIKLWDLEKRILRATLQGHVGAVWSVAFGFRGRTLVSGGEDGKLKVWDLQRLEEYAELQGNTYGVLALACPPDGEYLAVGSFDGTVALWELAMGECKTVLGRHASPVFSVTFSPKGDRVASASLDAIVALWDSGLERKVSGGTRLTRTPSGEPALATETGPGPAHKPQPARRTHDAHVQQARRHREVSWGSAST
jgi:WD40 repeat protein